MATHAVTTASRPLRIALMLESDGPGGAEVVLLRLAAELRERGHSIVPVGPARGEGWLGGRLRDAGFEPRTFSLRSTLDPKCALDLASLFRRERIDVVHSHEFTMAVYGAAAARLADRAHVITFHGSSKMCLALRRRVAVRWAMGQSATTIAVSRATRAQLSEDLGVRPERITVVPNGVPLTPGDASRVRAEFGCREGEVVLLAVGNLDKRKGHRLLLEALDRLATGGLDVPWRLVIAGGRGGPEHEPLLAFARERGLSDRVHIVTRRDDVVDLQAMSDVFVMPSLWEGLPMAMLEAMVAGKAVVASRTSGIPEAVDSGVHGLLTPPGDVDALADALAAVLRDPPLRRRLGEAARDRGQAEFSVQAMTGAYESLYARSLATAHRPTAA